MTNESISVYFTVANFLAIPSANDPVFTAITERSVRPAIAVIRAKSVTRNTWVPVWCKRISSSQVPVAIFVAAKTNASDGVRRIADNPITLSPDWQPIAIRDAMAFDAASSRLQY